MVPAPGTDEIRRLQLVPALLVQRIDIRRTRTSLSHLKTDTALKEDYPGVATRRMTPTSETYVGDRATQIVISLGKEGLSFIRS